jgi:hypothetical protein
MLIKAMGVTTPTEGSTVIALTNRHLNLTTGNDPTVRFHDDIRDWIAESGLNIRIGMSDTRLVAYGSEDDITLFTLAWL